MKIREVLLKQLGVVNDPRDMDTILHELGVSGGITQRTLLDLLIAIYHYLEQQETAVKPS